MEGTNLLAWAVKLFSWGAIAICSSKFQLPRKYPSVFSYMGAHAFLDVTITSVAFLVGTETSFYLNIYTASSLVTTVLAFLVLCQIYFVFGPFNWWRDWHLFLVPTLVFAMTLSTSKPLQGIWTGSYVVLTYLGLAASFRMVTRREIDLGWNLKMVLLAISIPSGLYTLVLLGSFTGSAVTYEVLSMWTRWVWVGSWVVLAVGMTEYSPPSGPGVAWTRPTREKGRQRPSDGNRPNRLVATTAGRPFAVTSLPCAKPGLSEIPAQKNRPISRQGSCDFADD